MRDTLYIKTFIRLILFGIISGVVLVGTSHSIFASSDIDKNSIDAKYDNSLNSTLTIPISFEETEKRNVKALVPIENESGLKVTPKVLKIKQNDAFPDLNNESDRKKLFSQIIIPNLKYGVIYEYVNADGSSITPSSEKANFQFIYVKITENYNSTSVIVPIPVTVTNLGTSLLFDNQIAIQTDNTNGKIILYPNETVNKSAEQLKELVKERSNVQAWEVDNGESIQVDVVQTTISANSVGTYKAKFSVNIGYGEEQKKVFVERDVVVFGANPQDFVTVAQNSILSLDPIIFFKEFQAVNNNISRNITYQFVDEGGKELEKFDTSMVGFQWASVKLTDCTEKGIETIVKIPVTVVSNDYSSIMESKVGISFNNIKFLNASELAGKTESQITVLLNKKIEIKAWELTSGKKLRTEISSEKIFNNSRGKKQVAINIFLSKKIFIHRLNILILPDKIFGAEDIKEWHEIPGNSAMGTLVNPLNGSKIGFPSRGILASGTETGFMIRDKDGRGYVHSGGNGRVSNIPGVYNKALYGSLWPRKNGIGYSELDKNRFSSKYFLRKKNELRQILVDEQNEIMFVYNVYLSRNLNFVIQLDMYNISSDKRKFSMLESVDTNYIKDDVPIYALGNNSGFYMQPSKGKRFTIKLKDSRGNWLTNYTKYIAGEYNEIGVYNGVNYFGNDFKNCGSENENYVDGQIIAENIDTAYQIGAPWEEIVPDDALNTGYEIFVGDEILYMQMKAEPEIFSVYQDYTEDFESNYRLSKIPTVNEHGTIYITYPNETEITTPFFSNNNKEFDDTLVIPREKLPAKLNEEPGTIKNYDTSLLAINESDSPYKGLPSQDYAIKIQAYSLGAKPIPQIIKKEAIFNKRASEIVQDAVILPGHIPSYEFEGEMPNTSITGLTSVTVRMTDTDQTDQTTLIKVPVQVIDGIPPIKGIFIAANDFNSTTDHFENLNESEINDLILEKSEAIAWDVATGSSKDIILSVESTSLPQNPEQGSYKAILKAVRGSEIVRKTITIGIQSIPTNQLVNVEFIDEIGESLHDKISFKRVIGTTIDLTGEEEVQQALQGIQAKNYQLVKKPENETRVPVLSAESTVQYQFKGMLFIQSSPNILNFGHQNLSVPFIKVEKASYDKPFILWDNQKSTNKWQLTATLKQALTNVEDKSKQLSSALKYKISDTEIVELTENIKISVEERKHMTDGEYNISEEWEKNKTGLILETPSWKVRQSGNYKAKILWQLEQTP